MISLIKAGSFDSLESAWAKELNVEPRLLIMVYYLSIVSEPKKKLTLQNFNGLIQKNLIPSTLDFQKKVFEFNKYLKANTKVGKYFVFNNVCERFYSENFDADAISIINGATCILQTDWDKIYQKVMDSARDWLKENQEQTLKEYNQILFLEMWEKYAKGNISAWEMESLCFYYHEHELINVNKRKYGISNFFDMPEQPKVDYFFKRNNKEIPIFKTYKIIGTVINKNDTKSSVSILTTEGVVNVKFTKEYYSMFNRQLSEPQDDGTKKVIEKSWFGRGSKILVTGFRRDDTFVAKRYKNTPTHQLYLIENINNNGDISLRHERYGGNDGE
jgi:DNA polymerase-3 subunit alpha